MDKAEILKRSREEHRNEDIHGLQIRDQASSLAVRLGGLVCLILSAIELLLLKRLNYESWVVFLTMGSAMSLYRWYKMKTRSDLLSSVLNVLLLLVFVYLYIDKLIRG